MAIFNILLALAAPSFVWSFALQARDQTISQCNADNCLRQVRSNSRSASPYCTSYLTNAHPRVYPVTVTSYTKVVPTVFHIGTGTAKSDYVTRKLTPYTPPGQKKRALTEAPIPTPAPALEARQFYPPSFASLCGDANRLSSACTCLIGNAPETTTKTVAQNIPGTYVTANVCGPTPALETQGGFNSYPNKPQIQFAEYPEINDTSACCSKCFHSPECASFNLDPQKPGCQLNYIVGSTDSYPSDTACPAGLAQIYAPLDDFNNTFGIGLCGYLLQSDE